MAERRRATLLQFAIAATTAVVPVLCGVLLIVASARQDAGPASRNGDRHVSVRHVAALKTFEYAIVRRDRVASELPSAETLLEQLPACRAQWDANPGALAALRSFLSRKSRTESSPASRIAAQLQTIDRALAAFSSIDNRRVSDVVGFDAGRWFAAVIAALRTPIETAEYPDQRFALRCEDIAAAVAALARSDGRILAAFAWRGTEVGRVVAAWRPEQFVAIAAHGLGRNNPWAGIPGCIYLGASPPAGSDAKTYFAAGARGIEDLVCARAEMRGISAEDAQRSPALAIAGEPTLDMPVNDERWKIPPSLGAILQPLEALHRPAGELYRAYTEAQRDAQAMRTAYRYGPNRIELYGAGVDVGYSIDLTIDPTLQEIAQRTAACYTGRTDVCRAFGIVRKDDGARAVGDGLLEHALVRMAAVAVIDVETGRIEALAGALSPCTRQEYDGPARSARCDQRLPYATRYRPDALLNPAVFHDAMPGSTIKPIMAAAFLADPSVGPAWLASERADMTRSPTAVPSAESLRGQLARSNSARFLDRMFCADLGFAPCARPREIQTMALAFGWNGACAEPSDQCGKQDLLFGRPPDARVDDGDIRPLSLDIPYGRLLTQPVSTKVGAPFKLRPDVALDRTRLQQCAAGADGKRFNRDDWGKCRSSVVDIVAEGWGQGQARASALGVAGMMAMLAAAANGQAEVRAPHLVDALRGVAAGGGQRAEPAAARVSLVEARQNRIPHEAAEVIIDGLSFSHRAGTARLACEQVFDARTCARMDWIAGKTGTPTFPNDTRSLSELARLCAGPVLRTRRDRDACGPLRPYKWYVAAYRTNPDDPRWTKVIGVLTERNWFVASGRVHGAGDQGPNPAAEIGMQIAARHAGVIPGTSE
jgi:hypothetical protein